jgi:DNA-binding CsgD family transcriptional regulator
MIDKLRIKVLYDDFISKVKLTEEQKNILDMLINKDKIIKISMELGISERTVNYEIKRIKKMYNDYLQMETVKLLSLLG